MSMGAGVPLEHAWRELSAALEGDLRALTQPLTGRRATEA